MLRALDLFCGAGGATAGLQRAGFHVTGVDWKAQPRYCGNEFVRADALAGLPWPWVFDFIWASPPCQAHTSLKTMHNAKPHYDLIPATRAMLRYAGVPYVIENVEGAPLLNPVKLCGTMFDLGCYGADLHRHRLFEASFPLRQPTHAHKPGADTIGVYGGHVRNRRRNPDGSGQKDFTQVQANEAMGVDWMTLAELSQAIPPAYSEYIARSWFASRVETLERTAQ